MRHGGIEKLKAHAWYSQDSGGFDWAAYEQRAETIKAPITPPALKEDGLPPCRSLQQNEEDEDDDLEGTDWDDITGDPMNGTLC